MKIDLLTFLVIGTVVSISPSTNQAEEIKLQTAFLAHPIEGFHKLTLTADLENGTGHLIQDPNQCALNGFGDSVFCTEIAPIRSKIVLSDLKINDLAYGRRLVSVSGAMIKGELALVVPAIDDNVSAYRFVYSTVGPKGEHSVRVVTLENTNSTVAFALNDNVHDACDLLGRIIDGKKSTAQVVSGFVNDTFILIVAGNQPHINTRVMLNPREYVEQPDYWAIEVQECRRGDIVLPTVISYTTTLALDLYRGKKGIEVVWADGVSEKIALPLE